MLLMHGRDIEQQRASPTYLDLDKRRDKVIYQQLHKFYMQSEPSYKELWDMYAADTET